MVSSKISEVIWDRCSHSYLPQLKPKGKDKRLPKTHPESHTFRASLLKAVYRYLLYPSEFVTFSFCHVNQQDSWPFGRENSSPQQARNWHWPWRWVPAQQVTYHWMVMPDEGSHPPRALKAELCVLGRWMRGSNHRDAGARKAVYAFWMTVETILGFLLAERRPGTKPRSCCTQQRACQGEMRPLTISNSKQTFFNVMPSFSVTAY